jgi:hypothetical protein
VTNAGKLPPKTIKFVNYSIGDSDQFGIKPNSTLKPDPFMIVFGAVVKIDASPIGISMRGKAAAERTGKSKSTALRKTKSSAGLYWYHECSV